jgi:hypothetical protein
MIFFVGNHKAFYDFMNDEEAQSMRIVSRELAQAKITDNKS